MERQNKNNSIKMRSLTQAMKSKELLAKHGIRSALVRTPGGEQGCGYSLYIPEGLEKARAILARSIGEAGGS